ncbi:uncharacterized protein L969DRAFT_49154 [Mixia osmundae IAM 14324]|uniref:Uncharacterized protein n=1 Tax=Mixia osmundae (strain CBS 9802 / IAM 14324 / JCM 22182 / KY 12970) TaxID=764103 RepID=G7E8C9_MIXOS|nr:uncharacterized protein L969DRAFT_49154 [Mixia osmundae IAM 14324]KEI39192.1 hypothetical protein L969DRAFT_49154 [Mixia osmundae IAM 14324]GAA99089.1 hypothetical protein E5Q_05778 [Mixia osmundae IAM 14324]
MARHAPHRCHCSRSVTYAVKLLGDMLALKNQGLHVHASVCRTDSVDRIAPVQGRADGLSSARLCSDSSECRDALLRVLWNRLLPPRASKFYDATLAYRDGQDEVIDTSGRGELAADPVTMPMPTEQLDSAKTSMRQSSNPSQPELAVSGGYLSQENSPGSSPLASSSSSLMSSARLSRPIGSRHSSFRTSQCFLSPNEEIVMPYFLSETQSPPSSSRSSLSSRSGQKSLAMTTIGPDSYRMELQGWTAPGEPEAYSNARYRQAKISQRVALRHERKAGKALTRGDMKSYERSRSQASTAWRECLSDLEEARMPARIG